jgi:hypothetical protein
MLIAKIRCLISAASALAITAASAYAQGSAGTPPALQFDTPTTVNGVVSVCTGIGNADETNTKWAAYPVKVEIAGKEGQYLGGATVTIKKDGSELATVTCAGPWILFKLAPGRYDVTGTIKGEIKTGVVYAPQSGQGRVILRFLNRGGAVSPQYVPPMH